MGNYNLNKKIINMISDMGYIIKDREGAGVMGSKR